MNQNRWNKHNETNEKIVPWTLFIIFLISIPILHIFSIEKVRFDITNDETVLVSFMAILFFLFGIKFYVEDNLKEELYRYKKYLVLKRKRATKIKVVNK